MEFIVQFFRALANRERIGIVRLLTVLGETRVSQIAESTGLELSRVSAHLRILAAVGLAWKRRSGRQVGYWLADHGGSLVTETTLQQLRGAFRGVRSKDPKAVVGADQADSATNSDAALFACFTAFTHPRRLQIIRHLAEHGSACLEDLMSLLSMSPRACLRHMAKLERRGFATRKRVGHGTAYVLQDGTGALQQAVLKAIREHLKGTPQ